MLQGLHHRGLNISFLWVPARVGVEGNENVDILAKQSLKRQITDIQVPLSKAEVKTITKDHMRKTWQKNWDFSDTGRHLYSIQKHVCADGRRSGGPKEQKVISRLQWV